MHSTKTEILTLLKRSDGATVDDLSTSIGLASMTVRQHLVALERDALVQAEEVRRATGRPHFRYRLTEEGHRRISDGYDRLVALLIEEAGTLEPDEVAAPTPEARRNALVRRAARALAQKHRADVAAVEGPDRMERVVAILKTYGGFAEFHDHQDGFELRDFNCIIRENVGSGPCEWHQTFLSEVLDAPVRLEQRPEDGCAICCRYVVATNVLAQNRGNNA
jgi:predicted ArsR family transcriptional regulator